jgi:hypothetical protein
MRAALALLCTVAILCPAIASADKTPTQIGEPIVAANCDVSGYKAYTSTQFLSIPDCGPTASTSQNIGDAEAIVDAVVQVDIDHTWIGDLNMSIGHDADCNGVAETSASLLCRTGMFDPSCPTGSCCGCSDDLGGIYTFDDAATAGALGDPFSGCYGGFAPLGCYKAVGSLGGFDGQSKEGCWILSAQDGACIDVGFIYSWTLYFNNEDGPTANEPATWGSVKTLYE